jgi:hypothetical protein
MRSRGDAMNDEPTLQDIIRRLEAVEDLAQEQRRRIESPALRLLWGRRERDREKEMELRLKQEYYPPTNVK